MQVLILGAGIIGLNTAYALMQQGYQVTVLDIKEIHIFIKLYKSMDGIISNMKYFSLT